MNKKIRQLAVTALSVGLITITTLFIRVPTAAGYVHAGDAFIYITANILPPPFALCASAVGGGLADLLSGNAQWILPTVIIKMLITVPFLISVHYLKKNGAERKIINAKSLLSLIPASLVTVAGYFIATWIIYGFSFAVADIIPELVQATAGAVIFIILGKALDLTGAVKSLDLQ